MTDERFVYQQDIREKNSTKSGAYHRISGAKSKRCTLPSDHLTAAEKRRRNSPVSTVKLNEPITYAELRKLSPSMQYLYLDHLIHEYHARRVDLIAMLGICQQTWSNLTSKLPGKLTFKGKKQSPSPEWTAFLLREAEPEATPAPEPETTPEPETPAWSNEIGEPIPIKAEDVKPVTYLLPPILSGSITMVAALPDLLEQLTRLVEKDTAYQFTVSFSRT